MKKEYIAPLIEYLAFSVCETFAADNGFGGEEDIDKSLPFNEGELGWT